MRTVRIGLILLWAALMVGAWFCMTGCTIYGADRTTADGDKIHIVGASLLTDKGITRAQINGLGSLEGYSSAPSVEAIHAAAEGAAAGVAKAVKPLP
jgi:hypothetical protein